MARFTLSLLAGACLCWSRGDNHSGSGQLTATTFQPPHSHSNFSMLKLGDYSSIGYLRGGSEVGTDAGKLTLASKLAAAASAARIKAIHNFHVEQHRSDPQDKRLQQNEDSSPANQSSTPNRSHGQVEKGAGSRASFLRSRSTTRPIPRWWWWRQQALQQEKDDEFAEILRRARASGDSSGEPPQVLKRSALEHNVSGHVLGSGKVVTGRAKLESVMERDDRWTSMACASNSLLTKQDGSDMSDAGAISDFTCSVRVKRLRKFNEAERLAERYARTSSPMGSTKVTNVAAVFHVNRFVGKNNGTQAVGCLDSGLETGFGGRGSFDSGVKSGSDEFSSNLTTKALGTNVSDHDGGPVPSDPQASRSGKRLWGRDGSPSVGKRRKSATPRVNKGLPKQMWRKVLHRVRCQYYDANLGQCTKKQPLFGSSREGQAMFCKNHSKMMHTGNDPLSLPQDVRSPRCQFLACRKHPVFGDARLQIALFCADHRYAHHVDCINRICGHVEGCARQASFASPDSRTPVFCLAHKEPHHVNVRSPRCLHYNETTKQRCTKQRSFGIKGSPPSYCRAHSNSTLHVNVVSPICQHVLGCAKIPSFGSIEQGQMLFCGRHRLPHHVNLRERNVTARQQRRRKRARTCLHPGCSTRAVFGDPMTDSGDPARRSGAVACKAHRMAHHVDLVNRMCQESSMACTRRATYGAPPQVSSAAEQASATDPDEDGRHGDEQQGGGARRHMSGPLYCRLHRKAGDIDLMNKRRCQAPGCKNLASHVLPPLSRPTHCLLHKSTDHVAPGFKPTKMLVEQASAV